ncbi:MAG: serine/threonine protein kinase, partial [Lentisphaeraceae bacterium]|nr:serine/threonine protein kinase [Lentisphaeraceae bacterium]
HRDLKPENIMKTFDGDIKLADLGIAKSEDSQNQNTIEGSALGTPYYISPEQAVDASKVDSRTDIYSLGATAYYLLTGTHPFSAETSINMILKHIHEPLEEPILRNASIPPVLSAIVCKMMAKDKADRYQSIGELKEALNDFKYGNSSKGKKGTSKQLGKAFLFVVSFVLILIVVFLKSGDGEVAEKAVPFKELSVASLKPLRFPDEKVLFDLGIFKENMFKETGWSRTQNKNYIRIDPTYSLEPFYYLKDGSFLINIRMHFSELGETFTSFYLNEEEFCFSGKERQFFSQGKQFGEKEYLGSNEEYIKGRGEKFSFTAYYHDGTLTYFINDKIILQKPFKFSEIKKVYLKSNKTKVYISLFEMKGNLAR